VDAVVFLLRTRNAADVALLKQIGGLVGGSAGALGIVGVASRADEIGAGRIDAMLSAKDVATRFTAEMNQTGIRQAVVPVSGLLALTARTLRQTEFLALKKLAGADSTELNRALLSVDRFVRPDIPLPVDAGTRALLLADTHAFEELRVLSLLPSRATTLNEDEVVSLRRIIGGSGTTPAARLGLNPEDSHEGLRAAFAAAQRWRRRAEHPLNDPFTTRACRAAVRSAEAMVAEFSAHR
jgi:hypothetical protein